MSPRLRSAIPRALLALCILTTYWNLTTMRGVLITDDIGASDLMNDGFPYRFYAGELLRGGEMPLWYPPVYGGFPLIARAESGVCYPPNLLLFTLLNPYVALNCVILLTLITAALGMYWYAREIGAGIHGAMLAALAFAYSGFMVSHLKHLSMVNAACWLPLGLLAVERIVRTPPGDGRGGALIRRSAGLGAVLALQILSGHIQIAYYSALAYVACFTVRAVQLRRTLPGTRTRAAWFAGALSLGVLAGAVQLMPTYELVTLSGRSHGVSMEYATRYDYDPGMAATFVYPFARGESASDTYRGPGVFWEDYGYVGLVTLIAAAIGLWKRYRSPHVIFFAGTAAAAYLVVLGHSTPIFGALFDVVPFMKYFRFQARMLFLVDASLAVLAGIGLGALMPGDAERAGLTRGSAAAWGLVALAAADLIYFQMRQNAIAPRADWEQPPQTAVALRAQADSGRIYSQGGIITHMAAYTEAHGWRGSLTPYIDQREYLQPSLQVLYGFSSADGYAQLTPSCVVDVWGDQNRRGLMDSLWRIDGNRFIVRIPYMRLLSLYNVRWILSPLPIAGEPLVFRGMVGSVRLYYNPDALPRAFIVGSWRIVPSDEASLAGITAPDFRPGIEAILREDPGFAPHDSAAGTARILSSRANSVVVATESPVRALLVLSDTDYPGWAADVDGAPARILRADHTMRAVAVPEGAHRVTFTFRPASVYAGCAVSLAGIAGLVLLAFWGGRRRG